jgi:hypothetical protein
VCDEIQDALQSCRGKEMVVKKKNKKREFVQCLMLDARRSLEKFNANLFGNTIIPDFVDARTATGCDCKDDDDGDDDKDLIANGSSV